MMPEAVAWRVIFTDHAKTRWQSRVYPRFDQLVAERVVRKSRPATKSERRKAHHGCKSRRRKATQSDRLGCLVNDDEKLYLFVVWTADAVIIKTVWRFGRCDDGD